MDFKANWEFIRNFLTEESIYEAQIRNPGILESGYKFPRAEDYKSYPEALLAMDSLLAHFLELRDTPAPKSIHINRHTRHLEGHVHDHNFIELCYCLTGEIRQAFYRDSRTVPLEEITLYPGNLIIIPPGMMHKIYPASSGDTMINIMINIHTFNVAFLGDLPKENPLYLFFSGTIFRSQENAYLLCRPADAAAMEAKLADVITSYIDTDSISSKMCDHYLSLLFLQVLKESENIKLSSSIGRTGALIAETMLYIRQNYASISLIDVARHFHYSETYMNKIFKKFTGMTILEFIQQTRMEKAEDLLKNPLLQIDQVAEMVGYNDTSYFIRLFKGRYGTTPFKYRKRWMDIGFSDCSEHLSGAAE